MKNALDNDSITKDLYAKQVFTAQMKGESMPIDWKLCPGEHIGGSLQRYYENGIPGGSFVTALLANDLVGAATKADHNNMELLGYIAHWMLHNLPHEAWGSYEIVKEWGKSGGAFKGTKYE